jgi:hypothetical protein
MQYGLNLPTGGAAGDARTLGEFAALAEASGWDGVFLEDYIVYQNRQDIPTWTLVANLVRPVQTAGRYGGRAFERGEAGLFRPSGQRG